MKVKDLIKELLEHNMDAEVNVIAHCYPYKFSICCGGGDGCTKKECETVDFYVDDLCSNEEVNI